MKSLASTAALLFLACAALPVSAHSPDSNSAAPAQAKPKRGDPNEVICERQEVIGSRLASKRVCRTRAEWTDSRSQDRQDLDRVQTLRSGPSGN